MIGTSFEELVFIRICIFILQYFPLLLIGALALTLIFWIDTWLVLILGIISVLESAFYLFVYLPKRRQLQNPATHPPLLPKADRKRLFEQGHAQIVDVEDFLTKWFEKAPLSEIKRENVKEFFAWSFLNTAAWGHEDDLELDSYADKIEELLGRPLEEGYGSAVPLRLTLDPVPILHHTLLWYTIVGLVDVAVYCYLTLSGFTYYRLRLSRLPTAFPFRLHTLASSHKTSSPTLSYYHAPHTSKSCLPILFIHGIGIGLYPYSRFLAALRRSSQTSEGQIGIIAIEIPQISSRLTGDLPTQQKLCADIEVILDRHGWSRFVLATHSFGSVVAANMLKHPGLSDRIGPMLFTDPVCFLLQLPDVAYNFTRRKPQRANEYQLHYFASTDMLIAHSLARKFYWAENVLWKEDLKGRNVTVALSGKDVIVPAAPVARYLKASDSSTVSSPGDNQTHAQMDDSWKSEGLSLLWYPNCDHAQMFDRSRKFARLVDVLRIYSAQVD